MAKNHPKTALIIVDVQNDFIPGGSLAVKEGDQIIPFINKLLQSSFDLKIATKDWHPHNHGSFAVNHKKQPGEIVQLEGLEQILWPVHCVQETYGSEFAPGWDTSKLDKTIYKGSDKNIDSYSTFFDNGHRKSTGLEQFLRQHKVTDIYIAGLATDYCVKYSVLDAIKLGFNTYVIVDACRGVNLHPTDSTEALNEMRTHGAHLITSKEIYLA